MLMVPKSARAHSINSRVVPKSAVARERVKVHASLFPVIWYAGENSVKIVCGK